MKKILGYIFTPFYYFSFGLLLAVFHPIQVAAHHLFGDMARKRVVDILNFGLVRSLHLLGCRIKFTGFEKIPKGRPLIIVSNHQSMFDIPPIVWGFRKYCPKFISKESLAKNLPSISYNLRHGRSALIDRKNRAQSVKEIFKLGRLIEETNEAASIFPEGTRSKTGLVNRFKTAGIETLLRSAPSAIIVPFAIDGHYQLISMGLFPLQFGTRMTYKVLDPVEPDGQPIEELVNGLHASIKNALGQGDK